MLFDYSVLGTREVIALSIVVASIACFLAYRLKTARKGKVARLAKGYIPFIGHLYQINPEKYLSFVYNNWKWAEGGDFEGYFLGRRILFTSGKI